MKKGDTVKVFTQVGLMKKPKWIKGELIAFNRNLGLQELKDYGFKVRIKHEDEYLVQVHENRLFLTPQNIREWRPLKFGPSPDFKCEKMEQFVSSQWQDLKARCQKAVEHFFPDITLVLNDEEKTIAVEDRYGPFLTVAPAVHEKQSIVAFFEVPAWEVVFWQSVPATRWEPEDVEEKNCGFAETTIGAASLLVDNIWRLRSGDYFQHLQDEEFAKGDSW